MASSNRENPMGDEQGTRVGKPDQPTRRPEHEEGSLGAGAEAVTDQTKHDREHRSGYGGSAGKPVESSDERQREDGEIL